MPLLGNLLQRAEAVSKVGGFMLDFATGELQWTAQTYRIHEVDETRAVTVRPRGVFPFGAGSRQASGGNAVGARVRHRLRPAGSDDYGEEANDLDSNDRRGGV